MTEKRKRSVSHGILAALSAAVFSWPALSAESPEERGPPAGVTVSDPSPRLATDVTASGSELTILAVAEKRCRKEQPEWKTYWLNFPRARAATEKTVTVMCWAEEIESYFYLEDLVEGPTGSAWIRYPGAALIEVTTQNPKVVRVSFLRH